MVTQLPEGRGGAGELVATDRRNPVSGGSLRPGEEAVGLLRFVTPCGQAMTPPMRCHSLPTGCHKARGMQTAGRAFLLVAYAAKNLAAAAVTACNAAVTRNQVW